MILYSTLGTDKRLNEIVFAGSHDAGIASGKKNERTQNLDIMGQAQAGVRFFDVRIAAEALGDSAQLKTFHGPAMFQGVLAPKSNKNTHVADVGRTTAVKTTNLRGGTFGQGLVEVLQDARTFVTHGAGSSEFLILKFDKSTNWMLIAETCVNVLGNRIYTGGGNLNLRTLGALAGKVIVLFPAQGANAVRSKYTYLDGIMTWKNLYKPPSSYDPAYMGLQYWGAGGTNPLSGQSKEKKMAENVSKQGKILDKAATGVAPKRAMLKPWKVTPGCGTASIHTLGVMYWTSTGFLASIEQRNNRMWTSGNRPGLAALWKNGLWSYIDEVLPSSTDPKKASSGGTLKSFMPNVVMVDFVDDQKCQYIYSLNALAAVELSKAAQLYG
jgi:hypothetical protein